MVAGVGVGDLVDVANADRTARGDHAGQYEEREDLRQRLQRLPRQQQAVLTLRYYLDLTDAEIADSMGCSVGTVRGYASRALATLRRTKTSELTNIERRTT